MTSRARVEADVELASSLSWCLTDPTLTTPALDRTQLDGHLVRSSLVLSGCRR